MEKSERSMEKHGVKGTRTQTTRRTWLLPRPCRCAAGKKTISLLHEKLGETLIFFMKKNQTYIYITRATAMFWTSRKVVAPVILLVLSIHPPTTGANRMTEIPLTNPNMAASFVVLQLVCSLFSLIFWLKGELHFTLHVLMISWQCQNLCYLSLAFTIDWRVVNDSVLASYLS